MGDLGYRDVNPVNYCGGKGFAGLFLIVVRSGENHKMSEAAILKRMNICGNYEFKWYYIAPPGNTNCNVYWSRSKNRTIYYPGEEMSLLEKAFEVSEILIL